MQKQNGFKMFERDMVNRGKLNSRDYADLVTMGIKKEDSMKYFANLRRRDLSIIPSESEQEKSKSKTSEKSEKPRVKREKVSA